MNKKPKNWQELEKLAEREIAEWEAYLKTVRKKKAK